MGANESHGPQRVKANQESLSHNTATTTESYNTSLNQSKSRSRKEIHNDEAEVDELEEDENMEHGGEIAEEDAGDDDEDDEGEDGEELDEENIDELMEEEDLMGSGPSPNLSYYPHQQQQQMPYGRSLQNILPHPGYQHDESLASTINGAPRNNRPIQVRQTKPNPTKNTDGTSAGQSADARTPSSMMSVIGSSVVNNGSSKKRTTPAKHKCPQCDKYFTRPFNLKSHQRTHTQERPFVCSFTHCARAFSRLHDCNRHMRTHWRIKPYSCPECHRNFVRQDALTRHLRLDFGHNRCSGYPGPVPGASSNHDKSDESTDEAMADDNSSYYTASIKTNGSNVTIQTGHPYKSPTSPVSSGLVSPNGQGHIRPETKGIINPERPMIREIRPAPALGLASSSDQTQPVQEIRENGEQNMRRDPIPSPHSRHPSTIPTPISFVHRSTPVERKTTPPNSNEGSFASQHSRSISHSSYSHMQSPVTSTPPTLPPLPTGALTPSEFANIDRKASPTSSRGGAPWNTQGHMLSNPPTRQLPPHILTAEEFERIRSLPPPQPEYPSSPQDAMRPSPPNHTDWGISGQEGPRSWNWDTRQQDTRLRNSSWASAPSPTSRGAPPGPSAQHPQDQLPQSSSIPLSRPPNMNMNMNMNINSWPRIHGQEDPNRMTARPSPSYPNSPFPVDPNTSQPKTRPADYHRTDLERDTHQRSVSEVDRLRGQNPGWTDQRSRPLHEMDKGVDARARFESHPHSPTHPRENPIVGRQLGVEGSSTSDRSHIYSGMVGAAANKQALAKESMMRDYRPTRSHSMMEYDSDRDGIHHQIRFTAEKPSLHEQRRSMSPISAERYSSEIGRSYDAGSRYSHFGDRPEQYSREDVDNAPSRQFRHDERALVMSPLPRDDKGGYYGELGRPNPYRPQGFPQSQQRRPEPLLHEQQDSVRRDRHSIDMPLVSSPSTVGPPVSKRPLTQATVATR
ncbi:hypothetical protein BGZ76_003794 [Entomortierella beljakovae]|nr:hypothetical protein BGZ76_003794 [Entomortierella beljakovae]